MVISIQASNEMLTQVHRFVTLSPSAPQFLKSKSYLVTFHGRKTTLEMSHWKVKNPHACLTFTVLETISEAVFQVYRVPRPVKSCTPIQKYCETFHWQRSTLCNREHKQVEIYFQKFENDSVVKVKSYFHI